MTSREGGAAFPIATIDGFSHDGMSLRDWFAGQALAGMLTNGFMPYIGQSTEPTHWDERDYIGAAYRIADAMIAARQEGEGDAP